ncbi:MAG: carboxypeptidase-like regulatory domain-containing protein [bacterium]
MGKSILLVALLVATVLAGCGGKGSTVSTQESTLPAVAADKGAIKGLLIDDRYRPIPDALLLLTPVGLTTTSDIEGVFLFTDLKPGAYVLQVQSKDHEAAPKNIDVVAGQYTEVEAPARRIFSDLGAVITTEYSVFVDCAVATPAATANPGCVPDSSGDTHRFGFDVDYRPYGKNITYLVTEMLANHKASSTNGALKVVVRDSGGGDPYFASKFTIDGDYLKLTMKYGNVSLDDTENRNAKWLNKEKMQTALFPQGSFKSESQQVLDTECSADPLHTGCFESRGLGAQAGVKAKFVQSAFIGPPSVDIAHYCVLAESC